MCPPPRGRNGCRGGGFLADGSLPITPSFSCPKLTGKRQVAAESFLFVPEKEAKRARRSDAAAAGWGCGPGRRPPPRNGGGFSVAFWRQKATTLRLAAVYQEATKKRTGKIPSLQSLQVKAENYTRFYISQYPGQGISRSPAGVPSTRAKSCRSRRMPISALTRRRMYRGASPRNMPTL